MPSVVVHEIVVEFEDGSSETFLADHVHVLQVIQRRLHVTAVATEEMVRITRAKQSQPVRQVTFAYRAADERDYVTTVLAGGPGVIDGADQIRYRRVAPNPPVDLLPVPPELIPAARIRPHQEAGGTFAVVAHGPREASSMSRAAEVAWHRWDCTWFYPV